MGFIRWLLSLLFGNSLDPVEIEAIADELDRYADRCRNAGEMDECDAAREAASRVRRARTTKEAHAIERAFHSERERRKASKPRASRSETGEMTVRYRDHTRTGGSVGWRNNNPGYIRCNDRTSSYGATSCDGEFAIFESEEQGRTAMVQYFREEYPNHSVREALQQQLPPEAGPNAAERVLESTGLNGEQKVSELSIDQVQLFTDSFTDTAGWRLGETQDNPTDTGESASSSANITDNS